MMLLVVLLSWLVVLPVAVVGLLYFAPNILGRRTDGRPWEAMVSDDVTRVAAELQNLAAGEPSVDELGRPVGAGY